MKLNKLRNPYTSYFLVLIFLFPFVLSCTTDDIQSNKTIELVDYALKFEQLQDVTANILYLGDKKFQNKISDKEYEKELKISLKPLVDNGKILYNKILNNVDLSNSKFELSNSDIDRIKSFKDEDFAQLSFIYNPLCIMI